MTDIWKNFNLLWIICLECWCHYTGYIGVTENFFRVENNIVLKAQLNIKNYQELI